MPQVARNIRKTNVGHNKDCFYGGSAAEITTLRKGVEVEERGARAVTQIIRTAILLEQKSVADQFNIREECH